MEKTVSYSAKNTYVTLNSLTESTVNIWVVFHGIGYLSRFFVKYFESLDPTENYIIAPQAPSKYYLKSEYKYVGASWLTKENTTVETENVLNYVDAVLEAEQIPSNGNLIVFGFSQGVSIGLRWMVKRKIKCSQLILFAGGIPNELKKEHLDFVDWETMKIKVIYGKSDEFLRGDTLVNEKNKMNILFGNNLEVITFEGGHEMKPEIIQNIL
ncbi:alpha/beta hydrolase [Flagellimonas sp. S3867]|uniref:alpha/beta hydrolase n=1 Tax=Flagellimonas sp. S3867 TaxID=2768063 RepID=UPI001683F621|nr:esterase [Flagellimonas sp. S3867]